MKPEFKPVTYPNGQKRYETPYVNGQINGFAIWWHINGQRHGLVAGWFSDGSLSWIRKWHQDQRVWGMNFTSQEQIPEDAEVELFFHETPELL